METCWTVQCQNQKHTVQIVDSMVLTDMSSSIILPNAQCPYWSFLASEEELQLKSNAEAPEHGCGGSVH
jgi:hypothetical protein